MHQKHVHEETTGDGKEAIKGGLSAVACPAAVLTPYDLARRVYETEACARSFEEDVLLHLRHGYVIARPDAFAMARPVWRHWSYKELASPWIVAPEGDCWWIWLLAGDMRQAMRWLPDAHRPWVGYERVNVPRFVRRERFIRG